MTQKALEALDELERMVFNSLPISTEPPAASAHVYFAQLRAALSALPPQGEPVGYIEQEQLEKLPKTKMEYIYHESWQASVPLYLAPPKPESPDNGWQK